MLWRRIRMKNHSPIYNLLHNEIRACAGHLLEISQTPEATQGDHAEHIVSRLYELHQFAAKVRPDERYLPLSDYKEYLENTMVKYQDDEHRLQSMRLSEAISLLGLPSQTDMEFKPSIVRSLTKHLVRHFHQDVKPGRPLFRKLVDINKL